MKIVKIFTCVVVVAVSFMNYSIWGETDVLQAKDRVQARINDVKRLLTNSHLPQVQQNKITVMVSSTVYGIEPILDEVYRVLTNLGYEVWMSHKGTLPVVSNKSAFENCIKAVENADIFLGIITPQYGSGVNSEGISITHKELLTAIRLKKTRWILAHDHVVFTRSLLSNLGYNNRVKRKLLNLRKTAIFGNLKVIDMYEDATLNSKPLSLRKGNWVQKYKSLDDVLVYIRSQFKNYSYIQSLLSSTKS